MKTATVTGVWIKLAAFFALIMALGNEGRYRRMVTRPERRAAQLFIQNYFCARINFSREQ